MHRCFTGSTGAEDLIFARLASSLEHNMPNAPMPVVIPSVQLVPHKHQGVGSSDNHRMHRCLGVGSTGATDFFTVSSILVPWTEEVSGRCPKSREGRLPLDPRPLSGTTVGAALRALLRLSSLCHHLNLKA